MRCPIVTELPPPPPDKTGWPWTEESRQLPDTMPDGASWLRVSIVAPSYNQGQFIEETIRSVLLQGYPNLEYIVADGGSADKSAAVIRKYEPWLTHWVSEPDRGQSHAINKALARSTREALASLNSDDCLLPGAVSHVIRAHERYSSAVASVGGCCRVSPEGRDSERVQAGLDRVKRYSWDETARQTLRVYHALHNRMKAKAGVL